ACLADRSLQKNRVIPAQIEPVFDLLDQLLCIVLVFQRPEISAIGAREISRLHISRKRRLRINMNKPRRPKADHSAISRWKNSARCFEINAVGLERAVNASPVN